jgi:flavin reductase (DIM6/NTAB) family NADH-FMN oxidoreductase RutF
MQIDVAKAQPQEVYQALIHVVVPRPIAWVSSVDPLGQANLAPFSFFGAFGSSPPVVIFSPVLRRDGGQKDTLLNVQATGEFVLNAAVDALAQQVNLTSRELPHGQSEAELAGLHLVPSTLVRPPRVAESPVHLECKVLQILPIGSGPGAANLVIGEVLLFEIDDAVLDDRGQVDPAKLRAIARLGGDSYCRVTDLFEMRRPQ